LARRVRRDLSNKKIRKIVRQNLKKSHKPTVQQPPSSFSLRTTLKRISYLIIFAGLIFLLYWVVTTPAFLNLFSSEEPAFPEQNQAQGRSVPASSSKNDEKPPEPQPILKPVKQKMQVEVLNGCGKTGIAAVTTDFLRKSEIDVIYSGNFKHFNINQSMVLDRVGNKDNAEKIAGILGIEADLIKTEINPNRQLDVTVILGKDYSTLKPFKK
jgi:hypothetical protein